VKLHLTYASEKSKITVHDEVVEIKAFQIIVWVSVSAATFREWDPGTPRFPAILDVGNNHNFSITEYHLVKWAGIQPAALAELTKVREAEKLALLRLARLWLHTDEQPFALLIDKGITVHDGDWPRLPLLGLRALTNSKLQTFIYGNTKQVVIRTPPKWYWPL